MTLKRINDFATEDPKKLDRELSQLEDNVDKETRSIRAVFDLAMLVETFRPIGSRVTASLKPGTQLSVDTSLIDARIALPELVPANFGRRFVLIKRAAANSIFCSCADPSVKYNGGAFPTVTAVGSITFRCDAAGYWS